ncbi:hypothetical protein FPB55_18655 [Pseudomonas sp. BJP69]|nr:hypothetical protein FPB55_18655 [Pseudomonas sp. BJP69]
MTGCGGGSFRIFSACAGLFAGTPAPTGISQGSRRVRHLWERARPRRGQYRRQNSGVDCPTSAFIRTLPC